MSRTAAELSAPGGSAGSLALAARNATRWRVLLLAGRREAVWLARSPLVLAGLAISAWLVWLNNRTIAAAPYPYPGGIQPTFWWAADVSIVTCLLAACGGVLIAAQLAAGRARRDGMSQLYESLPSSAALRTGAHLLGAFGPVLLATVLIGASVAWLDSQPALGAPRLWVLGGGLILIALASGVGTAVGVRLRHPMAGIILVLVLGLIEIDLALSFANPVHLPGGVMWLFPWADPGAVLTGVPGLTVPYPPPAHLIELAGLIVIACVAALWPATALRRRGLATVAVVAVAAAAWSGWLQARPPSSELTALANQVTRPGPVEQCQSSSGVRYCYYPAFSPMARQWAVPVAGVLALVPASARRGLVVRQVWYYSSFLFPPLVSPAGLTSNGPGAPTPLMARLYNFGQALSTTPGLLTGSSRPPVYTDAAWTTGIGLGSAQFGLALSAAQWATGLPTTGKAVSYNVPIPGGGSQSGTAVLACVPAGQARASIALWLAASATAAARSAFESSLPTAPARVTSTPVGKVWVATVRENGSGPSVGLNATVQSTALSAEMLRLPQSRVESVLAARWAEWLQPRASAAALAAALGLRVPSQPVARPTPLYSRGNVSYGYYVPPTQVCQ